MKRKARTDDEFAALVASHKHTKSVGPSQDMRRMVPINIAAEMFRDDHDGYGLRATAFLDKTSERLAPIVDRYWWTLPSFGVLEKWALLKEFLNPCVEAVHIERHPAIGKCFVAARPGIWNIRFSGYRDAPGRFSLSVIDVLQVAQRIFSIPHNPGRQIILLKLEKGVLVPPAHSLYPARTRSVDEKEDDAVHVGKNPFEAKE